MRLNKPMIRAFTKIAHGTNNIEELATTLGKSPNRTVEIIGDLEKEGFVKKIDNYSIKGSRKILWVANTPHATKLKEIIFEYSTIKFEDILSDSKLLFLASLCEDWTDMKTATKLSKITKYMVDRYKSMLKNRGIIIRKNNLYKINEKAWPLLKEFLINYKNYSQIMGVVKWKYQDEIIFEVDNEDLIKGNTTGFYSYKDYGVEVGTISALCTEPKRKISKEEVFVHSLFELDDPRTLHLALTFYIKNKLDYNKVILLAMKYGKYSMFENFFKLIKTKEERVKFDYLPTFDRKDFIRIANMYGVSNV